jgi:hypothetical protein
MMPVSCVGSELPCVADPDGPRGVFSPHEVSLDDLEPPARLSIV